MSRSAISTDIHVLAAARRDMALCDLCDCVNCVDKEDSHASDVTNESDSDSEDDEVQDNVVTKTRRLCQRHTMTKVRWVQNAWQMAMADKDDG